MAGWFEILLVKNALTFNINRSFILFDCRALAAKLEDKEYPCFFNLSTTRLYISLAMVGFSAAIYSICIKVRNYKQDFYFIFILICFLKFFSVYFVFVAV